MRKEFATLIARICCQPCCISLILGGLGFFLGRLFLGLFAACGAGGVLRLDVAFQVAVLGRRVVALRALELLRPGVCQDMYCQIAALGTRVVALRAFEGLLPGVCPDMCCQVALVGKRLVAVCARVRLGIRMALQLVLDVLLLCLQVIPCHVLLY